ncbi:MAG: hypothetical protein AAB543_08935 [Pseudomonadota bacterium]
MRHDGHPRKIEPVKPASLIIDAVRMGGRILWWAVVLGLVLSALFAVSAPGEIDWTALAARGLIIGVALTAGIVIIALLLPDGLHRK